MPSGGSNKKPVALKKMQGTYRKDRDSKKADPVIAQTQIILDVEKVKVPKTITSPEVRKYYKQLTQGLLAIGVLSGADLPQIEQLCLILQKLKEVQEQFIAASVFDADFDIIEKRYLKLVEKFDFLASKYYVSPVARSKIRLDDLNIREKELTVQEKETNAISKILLERENRG